MLPPLAPGPLDGHSVAVKDVYAVAGQRVGAGNPAWLAAAPVEPDHAWAVQALLAAGASVRGIARTDELAYGIAGINAHSGMPPNGAAPGRVPGGSSSGSASAVALGHATIGLGTDTAGSIRVPAAYQGLYGIRTSHGAVDRTGLLPLAPSFDTVGWVTRTPALLRAVGEVLLPSDRPANGAAGELVVVADLVQRADDDVRAAIAEAIPAGTATETWPDVDLDGWRQAFQTVQAHGAWRVHGRWLVDRLDTLGPGVRGRFRRAARLDRAFVEAARRVVDGARDVIRERVDGRVLVVPTTSSAAPLPEDAEAIRDTTLTLTAIASIGSVPAVTVPAHGPRGCPSGSASWPDRARTGRCSSS